MTGKEIHGQIELLKKQEADIIAELKRLRKNCIDDQETDWERNIDKDERRVVRVLYADLVENVRKPMDELLGNSFVPAPTENLFVGTTAEAVKLRVLMDRVANELKKTKNDPDLELGPTYRNIDRCFEILDERHTINASSCTAPVIALQSIKKEMEVSRENASYAEAHGCTDVTFTQLTLWISILKDIIGEDASEDKVAYQVVPWPHSLSSDGAITQLEAELTRFRNLALNEGPGLSGYATVKVETFNHWLSLIQTKAGEEWSLDKEVVGIKGFPPRTSHANYPINPRQG